MAICRKCYVHPRVLESYLAGKLASKAAAARRVSGLSGIECRILAVIEGAR